jgi:hypothetical protein
MKENRKTLLVLIVLLFSHTRKGSKKEGIAGDSLIKFGIWLLQERQESMGFTCKTAELFA